MQMNISQVRKGDIVRFKAYSLRVEQEPTHKNAFVCLFGRINVNGCPLTAKTFHDALIVDVERT